MSVQDVTLYTVQCDCCGKVLTEEEDFGLVQDSFRRTGLFASSYGWWAAIDVGYYCRACWCWLDLREPGRREPVRREPEPLGPYWHPHDKKEDES